MELENNMAEKAKKEYMEYRTIAKSFVQLYESNILLQIMEPVYLNQILKQLNLKDLLPEFEKNNELYSILIQEMIEPYYMNKTEYLKDANKQNNIKSLHVDDQIKFNIKLISEYEQTQILRDRLHINTISLLQENYAKPETLKNNNFIERARVRFFESIKYLTPTKEKFMEEENKIINFPLTGKIQLEILSEKEQIEDEIFEIIYGDQLKQNLTNITNKLFDDNNMQMLLTSSITYPDNYK